MTLAGHAYLNRELAAVLARLKALAPPDSGRQGDEADQRTRRQEHEDVVNERARLAERRRLIVAALGKIARSEYGACETCALPITAKRLAAQPWAERCLSCQTAFELHEERLRYAGGLPPVEGA